MYITLLIHVLFLSSFYLLTVTEGLDCYESCDIVRQSAENAFDKKNVILTVTVTVTVTVSVSVRGHLSV
jgi:hypothetical protein